MRPIAAAERPVAHVANQRRHDALGIRRAAKRAASPPPRGRGPDLQCWPLVVGVPFDDRRRSAADAVRRIDRGRRAHAAGHASRPCRRRSSSRTCTTRSTSTSTGARSRPRPCRRASLRSPRRSNRRQVLPHCRGAEVDPRAGPAGAPGAWPSSPPAGSVNLPAAGGGGATAGPGASTNPAPAPSPAQPSPGPAPTTPHVTPGPTAPPATSPPVTVVTTPPPPPPPACSGTKCP